MAKNDKIILIGGAAVAAVGLWYAHSQGYLDDIIQQIEDLLKPKGDDDTTEPIPPPVVKNFVALGEWGGAVALPMVDAMIRTKPDLIVGLGNYDSTETKFKPVYDKIATSKIPGIWAKGADSDDYLSLFGQDGWEFKYEPEGVIFCVLNSVNETTLEDMLKTSTARFKIVIINAPLFSPSSKFGQDVTGQEKLAPILTKYKVSLVLSAKNKIYYRYIPKFGPNTTSGVTFVGVGTGSTFDGAGTPNGATKVIQGKNGYLACEIGTNMNCRFITQQGQVLDQFTVFEWK